MIIELSIDGMPRLPNAMMYAHWAVKSKHAKDWKAKVMSAVIDANVIRRGEDLFPLKKARLTIIRCSSKEPDHDNLVASHKHIIDGLVQSGLILDDNPSVIVESNHKWEPAGLKHGKIKIKIESVEEDVLR